MAAKDVDSTELVDLTTDVLRDGIATAGGEEFLAWAARTLRSQLGADHVLIGELVGSVWDTVRCLVYLADGEISSGFEYSLAGAPCEVVINHEPCCFPRNVHGLFPDDPYLEGFESYVGVPLRDQAGRQLGLVAALWREPTATARHLEQIQELRVPIERHVESLRAVRELSQLIEYEAPVGTDPFGPLVGRFAEAFGVRAVLICAIDPEEKTRGRILALSIDGRVQGPFDGDLSSSPCADLYGCGDLYIESNLRERYPGSGFAEQIQAESFYGRLILDDSGAEIGHFAIFHDHPLPRDLASQPLVRVFTARVGAELRRVCAERRREEMERELFAAQRMESLGVLAGGIAHDFNNILVGVLCNASFARREVDPDSRAVEHIDQAISSAERAAELVGEILAYSGKAQFEVAPADLSTIVQDMAHLLGTLVPKGVRLSFELDPELPAVVVDATQVRQVVMNLVLNAAEASGDSDGEVRVRVALTDVDASTIARAVVGRELSPETYVQLEVADRGAGMSAETLARVFEPFFTTKRAGRGLGLAAVRGIVSGHRGALLVESKPGLGTTFRVLLPISLAEIEEVAPEVGDVSDRSHAGTVLVVDDESVVRSVVSELLCDLGFEVLEAVDGLEAIEAVREHPDLSLVILDLTMPRMHGCDTIRVIRTEAPTLPVILMSGYAEVDAGCINAADGFLRKPFRLEALRKLLDATLPGAAADR